MINTVQCVRKYTTPYFYQIEVIGFIAGKNDGNNLVINSLRSHIAVQNALMSIKMRLSDKQCTYHKDGIKMNNDGYVRQFITCYNNNRQYDSIRNIENYNIEKYTNLWASIVNEYSNKAQYCIQCYKVFRTVCELGKKYSNGKVDMAVIIAVLSGAALGRPINIEYVLRYVDNLQLGKMLSMDKTTKKKTNTIVSIQVAMITHIIQHSTECDKIVLYFGDDKIGEKGVALAQLYKYIYNRFDNYEEALIQYKRWYKISAQTEIISSVLRRIKDMIDNKTSELIFNCEHDEIYIQFYYDM